MVHIIIYVTFKRRAEISTNTSARLLRYGLPCMNLTINHHIIAALCTNSLRKTVRKVSPILVTLTSRNDFDFESSNDSLKENKPDGVNPNSNDIDYYVRKNEGKILWFSAD